MNRLQRVRQRKSKEKNDCLYIESCTKNNIYTKSCDSS